MAKLRRLFETDTNKMPATNPKLEKPLDDVVSQILNKGFNPKDEDVNVSLPTPTFQKLLGELGLEDEVAAMLSRFFVMDRERRPTSEDLLKSDEYGALKTAAKLSTIDKRSNELTVGLEQAFGSRQECLGSRLMDCCHHGIAAQEGQ